ncbi:hypothetical protein BDW22DRAFT_1399021 [Trametopsis cervina]|nr:hypothetical protein BDW22DRAFT_1399021 [Trametopsis cervina]
MSKSETTTREDFDFWEFVSCGRCHLPFSADSRGVPSVPFWVTECGHVLCNTHLNSDQSCAKCGQRDIQVSPLQREIDQPMSDWFTAVPQSLDTMAYAAKFQFEQLATLVRHYKRKASQQRMIIEKLKAEVQSLQSTAGELQTENQQLREYIGETSDMPNVNGKRRMQESYRHITRPHTNSSPRSMTMPIAPDRLTLPPSHQQPGFSGGHHRSDDTPQAEVDRQAIAAGFVPSRERPGSRRISE